MMDMASTSCPCCGGTLALHQSVSLADWDNHVIVNGCAVKLRPSEFTLFRLLWNKSPKILERHHFMDEHFGLFSEREHPSEKIVDVHIARIRQKLGPLGINVKTAWGKGWYIAKGAAA